MSEPPAPTTERDVFVAVVLLHPRCNMTCSFCVTPDDAFEALDEAQAHALVDELAARGLRTVVFGGGEPFAWRGDLLRLAGAARARGLVVQVGTNGIALPAGFAADDAIDRWVLPLESADAAVHDRLRRHGPGHHALILRRLEALRAAGREVTLSTVLCSETLAGVAPLAEALRGYQARGGRVHAWHLYRFLPWGRGGAPNAARLAVSADAYADACARVEALGLPFRTFRRADMYRSKNVEFVWRADGVVQRGIEPPRGASAELA
ncbi:MAG: radical SAM protein [Planctomycetes bacterium]|nr:radical SAM protein [Planctomycetota bacterium]